MLTTKPSGNNTKEASLSVFFDTLTCLVQMWGELKNEGCYFNKGIIEGTGRRTQPVSTKYSPYRICEEEKTRYN